MSLTAAEVEELMRLVEQSGFDELTLDMNGIKLTLRRGTSPVRSTDQLPSAPAVVAAETREIAPQGRLPPDSGTHEIASPMLGTFYRAPKPGAPPYVEIGAKVEEDTVIGIIEVMKLMNSVRAGVRGIVTEILITDGQFAEYGEPLMRVRRTG